MGFIQRLFNKGEGEAEAADGEGVVSDSDWARAEAASVQRNKTSSPSPPLPSPSGTEAGATIPKADPTDVAAARSAPPSTFPASSQGRPALDNALRAMTIPPPPAAGIGLALPGASNPSSPTAGVANRSVSIPRPLDLLRSLDEADADASSLVPSASRIAPPVTAAPSEVGSAPAGTMPPAPTTSTAPSFALPLEVDRLGAHDSRSTARTTIMPPPFKIDSAAPEAGHDLKSIADGRTERTTPTPRPPSDRPAPRVNQSGMAPLAPVSASPNPSYLAKPPGAPLSPIFDQNRMNPLPERLPMATEAYPTRKQTCVEEGTEFKGTMKANCAIVVNGVIDGEVEAPEVTVNTTGGVLGSIKAKKVRALGTLAGRVEAEDVFLSGTVRSDTVVKAKRLEVKLGSDKSEVEVTFGQCRLETAEVPGAPAKEGGAPRDGKSSLTTTDGPN